MLGIENHIAFQDAVDSLERLGFKLSEIAAALGFSHQYVRAMRVWSPLSKSRRNVPPATVWRPALREMARLRASALTYLVERLETTDAECRLFLREYDTFHTELRERDPAAWAELERERREFDGTLMDGLR